MTPGSRELLYEGFFDLELVAVKEYSEKVGYIYWKLVSGGFANRSGDWEWSSIHDYTGTVSALAGRGSPIPVDRIMIPDDDLMPI